MASRPPKAPSGAGSPFGWFRGLFDPSVQRAVGESQKKARRIVAAKKAAETRKEKRSKKEKKERAKKITGLSKRARDVLLDILDRMLPADSAERPGERVGRGRWEITAGRSSDRAGAATATAIGEPFWPGAPNDTRYDRTIRALTPAKKGPVSKYEANVRAEHENVDRRGKAIRRWETIVPLEHDPHALITRFDAVWEEVASGDVRHGIDYGGPVTAIEVYFVEHRK